VIGGGPSRPPIRHHVPCMLVHLRNAAIIALLALLLSVAPGSDNFVTALFTTLTLAFVTALGLLAAQFWKRNSLTRDVMTERQRIVLYGAIGTIALMIAGTDELLDTGPGTVAWFVLIGLSGYLVFTTWREANSY
jgi:hypothetical protein